MAEFSCESKDCHNMQIYYEKKNVAFSVRITVFLLSRTSLSLKRIGEELRREAVSPNFKERMLSSVFRDDQFLMSVFVRATCLNILPTVALKIRTLSIPIAKYDSSGNMSCITLFFALLSFVQNLGVSSSLKSWMAVWSSASSDFVLNIELTGSTFENYWKKAPHVVIRSWCKLLSCSAVGGDCQQLRSICWQHDLEHEWLGKWRVIIMQQTWVHVFSLEHEIDIFKCLHDRS